EDCLTEAMDIDGLLDVLHGLRDGRIRRVAVDTAEPSAFARGILNVAPYGFLDDVPLEERRTQAVIARRHLDARTADTLGALDRDAVERVRAEAWPDPESAEELHEALLWMGFVTGPEVAAAGWTPWLEALAAAGRVVRGEEGAGDRWFAVEATRDPGAVLRGRLEALGPVAADKESEPLLLLLEAGGAVLRCRIDGRTEWCERRLLARIQRYTLDRLRREIEPISAAEMWRFLAAWQHVDPAHHLDGPRGVATVVRQLAGFEIPAAAWEATVLPLRVRNYRREWLDELTLTGEVAWGRLWGRGNTPVRSTPVCLVPRADLATWTDLAALGARPALIERGDPIVAFSAPAGDDGALSTYAGLVLAGLEARGACFAPELQRESGLLPEHFEAGLTQLIGHGLVTCDSYGGLRRLLLPPSRRRGMTAAQALAPAGRWSRFREGDRQVRPAGSHEARAAREAAATFAAMQLLARYGVVFRRLLERERIPLPWRDLVAVYRRMELRGELRGGRFVQRFSGEQYALPEAVEMMRRLRRQNAGGASPEGLRVAAGDPLNLEGILTPESRISAQTRRLVAIG
ncbi:MAG: ATP-dependent DNA helicase, partial [Candidatus Eisenbacteria bacterium]